jgi:hypothetical protein
MDWFWCLLTLLWVAYEDLEEWRLMPAHRPGEGR